jgi:colicin import membrane protein
MERKADRVLSISLSIVVHLAIVGALFWGWLKYRNPAPTPQSLAIEGTVVSNQPVSAPTPPSPVRPAEAPPAPAPAPDVAAQQAAAQHQRDEQARIDKAAADKAAAEKVAVEKAATEKAATEKAAADKAAADRVAADKAAAEKATADKAAAAKATADKAAADKAEETRRQEAARVAKADADRKALEQQRQADERARREADLKSALAAEEHQNAVQSGPARAEYLSLITARINHAWIRPPSARSGVRCTVHITQVPGGVVTHVSVTGCNGDDSVRQSVETAAYRASPLPAPADPALFDPNIDVTFAPDE